jgi:uncharacterized membrane protein YbhN (UPF0104 family)
VARKALSTALAVLGVGVLVPVLVAHRHDVAAALALLVTVCPAWLSVAALAEAVSYLTRGGATRALLRGAAPTVGTTALAAITLVGDAVAYVLPFGFAAGGAVAVGQARRRGAPRVAAVWGFAVVTVVGVAVLSALGIAAAAVAVFAFGPAAPASGPGLVVAVAGAAGATLVIRRWRARARGGAGGSARQHPRPRVPAQLRLPGDAASARLRLLGDTAWPRVPARLRAGWAQLRVQPLPPRAIGAAALGMLLSWLADLAVLALAFVALGEQPPWAGLVLAYCLGQAASALPFTPGGLAVVEGGLTAALVAFGGCPAGTLTAVLLYRLISHWAIVPAGGLAWLALRRRAADEFRLAPWSALAEGDERCPTRT